MSPDSADDAAALAQALRNDPPEPGWELAGLLAAEPVTGRAVAACWVRDAGDNELELRYELRSPSGDSLADPDALEALLAMCAINDALEALAPPDLLEKTGSALHALIRGLDAAPAQWLDALSELAAVAQLTAPPASQTPLLVTHERLDTLAAALRRLDTAWTAAEEATGTAVGAGRLDPPVAEQAFQIFAPIRQLSLATPPAVAVERGRAAARLHARDARATMFIRRA